jgi:hypothetical protein
MWAFEHNTTVKKGRVTYLPTAEEPVERRKSLMMGVRKNHGFFDTPNCLGSTASR